MRLRKRHRSAYTNTRRDDDASDADGAQESEFSSLKGFRTLPIELQSIVIELACLFPPTTEVRLGRGSFFIPDYSTATSLSLASKSLNRIVQPLLLSHIIITRPSALSSLCENLAARTMSHELIKSIHIGPLEPLPADWEQLPEGYEDKHAWALDRRSIGCREAAIHDALDAAQGYYRLNLRREAVSESSTKVAAVLEVQAALDLYLQEVRRLEEEEEPELKKVARPGGRVPLQCRTGRCSHYPALLIHDAPHENRRPLVYEGKCFVIRRAEILCHLSRKGATADRFDHPLAFARSGFQVTVAPRLGQGYKEHAVGAARYGLDSETWKIKETHESHEWPEVKLLESAIINQLWWGNCQPTAGVLITMGSFALAIRYVRGLLRRLRNLQNLSLTGSLERALDASLSLPKLRRLSVGPYPGQWYIETNLDGLERLEKLRVAGAPLVKSEIRSILTGMPRLREMEWSLAEKFPRGFDISLAGTFDLLFRREALRPLHSVALDQEGCENLKSASQPRLGVSHSPQKSADKALTPLAEDLAPSSNFSDPLIIAKLHPTDVLKVLATAPSDEVREAWLEGRQVGSLGASLRRLRLEECKAVASTSPTRDSTSEAWGRMYEDGREWWLSGVAG